MRFQALLGRRLRLGTGLLLFGYATCHFANHAAGLVSLDAMDAASRVLAAPWTTVLGQVLLYGAMLIHAALGLAAVFGRRHLGRMPITDAVQIGLGLLVPVLLVNHAVQVRVGSEFHGFSDDYDVVLSHFWLTDWTALAQQFALLLAVWMHGCIGLRASLQLRPVYPMARPWLATAMIVVPVLAMLGVLSAGSEIERLLEKDATFAQKVALPVAGSAAAASQAALDSLSGRLSVGWVVLVAVVFVARLGRSAYAGGFGAVLVSFGNQPGVRVKRGLSILEASRVAGLRHASVCGGRGRCSTCVVRVLAGHARLPPPNSIEKATLRRVGAPPQARLACQLRPVADITVVPLLEPGIARARLMDGSAGVIQGGRERMIVALFADLRDSSRLTTDHLPFDALFLLDCWVHAVSVAVRQNSGEVTSVAGDGVMAVFGAEVDEQTACRQALAAAAGIRLGVAALNREIGPCLNATFRFGIGIHVGLAVIGETGTRGEPGARSLQFFGEPGIVASRLEELTKERGCEVLASRAVMDRADIPIDETSAFQVVLRGRGEAAALEVCALGPT